MVTSLIRPSYHQGFARSAGESNAPHLWRGKVGHWEPSLGITGITTLNDMSPYKNHGTMNGSMTIDDWVLSGNPRLPGYALDLEGTDDSISVDNAAVHTNYNNGSFVAWVNRAFADDTAADKVIFRIDGDGSNRVLTRYAQATDGWRFRLQRGGTNLEIATGVASIIPQNTWTFFVLTWSTLDNQLIAYINGINSFSDTNAGTQSTAPTLMNIGANTNETVPFQGMMSGMRVYDHALTPDEVWELYIDPLADLRLRSPMIFKAPVVVAVTVDMWHPEIQKPYIEVPEILSY